MNMPEKNSQRIGILTFNQQLNYGGVLQSYALQRYLRNQGYDAEVITYWLSENNAHLKGHYWFD
ncbi:MAG: polysaccharide pyruvyl transferase family protein, partial [Bacillota bacterium]